MVEVALRRARRTEAGRLAAAVEYAEMGWPVCPGAVPRDGGSRLKRSSLLRSVARDTRRACSCDRIGCPAPGAHPVSAAWQIEASSDTGEVARCWRERPEANIILVTGRVFDVLDVPAAAGTVALERMDRSPAATGPVALTADDRAFFFVTTRGAPADEDEWWSCHLDCEPDSFAPAAVDRPRSGSGIRDSTRCRTGCGCLSSWPTPAKRSCYGRSRASGLRYSGRKVPDRRA